MAWVLGLVNAFKHSQDAWSSVGTAGVALSIVAALTALAAGCAGRCRWLRCWVSPAQPLTPMQAEFL